MESKEATSPFSLLNFFPDQNSDPSTFKDSNTLYKQLMEEPPAKSTHAKMLDNLENQINSLLSFNKPKTVVSTRRNSVLKANKSVNNTARPVKLKDGKKELSVTPKADSVVRLHEEILLLRSEVTRKEIKINELVLENETLKSKAVENSNFKKCMQKLLEVVHHQLGSSIEKSLSREKKLHSDSSEVLFREVKALMTELINERNMVQRKYAMILELHNNLLKENGKYSIEYIYKIMDENETMKKKLKALYDKKLYIF
eukprot:TRINITY_DN6618_c0_g1_i6.p2 TRINITY_DN6618_c0_g1~~TRINITY_DN6618_c0_g1_i6.p2  ORF type:complete len:278 (-),score=81.74 TRINITY_DN6618_c0_g1_i6:1631-2401(-)